MLSNNNHYCNTLHYWWFVTFNSNLNNFHSLPPVVVRVLVARTWYHSRWCCHHRLSDTLSSYHCHCIKDLYCPQMAVFMTAGCLFTTNWLNCQPPERPPVCKYVLYIVCVETWPILPWLSPPVIVTCIRIYPTLMRLTQVHTTYLIL